MTRIPIIPLTLAASFLIASLSIAYYYVLFLPEQSRISSEQKGISAQHEQTMENLDLYQEVYNKKQLDACLQGVDEKFANVPNPFSGEVNTKDALAFLNFLSDEKEKAKNECFKRYPSN